MSSLVRRQGQIQSGQARGPRESIELRRRLPMEATDLEDSTHAQIQARAYQIYLDRTHRGSAGDADGDWYQAEREFRGGASNPGAAAEHMVKSPGRAERLTRSE